MLKNKRSYMLLELAIVMTIIGLFLTFSVSGFFKHLDSLRYKGTYSTINNLSDFLVNYLSLYGRLPCPASGSAESSVELDCKLSCTELNRSGVVCYDDFVVGVFPFDTLMPNSSINRGDDWGYKLTYIVQKNLAGSASVNLKHSAYKNVNSSFFINRSVDVDLQDLLPLGFVIMSHGALHRGAWSKETNIQDSCTSNNNALDFLDIKNCTYTSLANNKLVLYSFAMSRIKENSVLANKGGNTTHLFYDDIVFWKSLSDIITLLDDSLDQRDK